ncbi:MAG: molybdenum cofactor cytidylyltransferase [Clostridiales bacterium]|nr:molybdenum cofactor cytidylyltransferase [Clostridiales bacterium]
MISAIILAAGLSSRMGKNKLLLPLGKQSVIEHVVEKVSKSQVDDIIVVLGNDAKDIEKILERFDVRTVINSDFLKGQSTSVKTGILEVDDCTDGALFIMGDQPLIKTEIINDIIHKFYECTCSIVVPTYNNQRGNPVLFGNNWFEELDQIQGDKGGRDILKNNLDQVCFMEISDDLFLKDIDDEAMYQHLKREFGKDDNE